MPIRGLTDRGMALSRLGIIRKGGPKPANGNRPGPDLTYFRLVTDYPEVAKAFTAAFGEQPKRVNVVFVFDTVEDVFEAWREHWVAGGLKHRCDGETMVLWQDEKGQYRHERRPCPDVGKPEKDRRCKVVGRLSAVIPELERIATVTILTTSKHDLMSLQQSLEAAQFVQGGKLRGIPFVLTRREREVSTPGEDGKRARRKKSLLFIEPAHKYAKFALQRINATPLLLPAPEQANGFDEEDDRLVDTITGEIIAPYDEPAPSEEPKDRQKIIAKPVKPAMEISSFANVGALLTYGHKTTGLSQKDMLNLLGVENSLQIKDLAAAARVLLNNVPATEPATESELPAEEREGQS